MARLPTPGADNGTWGVILNDFLQVSHGSNGGLKPGTVGDAQVSSIGQSKIAGLAAALDAKASKVGAPFSRGITLVDPEVTSLIIWRAPFACEVVRVLGYRSGGSGATINTRRSASASTHLASDLSLSTADSWLDGGQVQHTTLTLGDSLEVLVTAVSGSPAQLVIQVDLQTV